MTLKGWIDNLPRRLSRITTSGLVIPEIVGLYEQPLTVGV